LPWNYRVSWPIGRLGPDRLKVFALVAAGFASILKMRTIARRLNRLASPNTDFLRWAYCAVLAWRRSQVIRNLPVFQIHSEYDKTLPARLTKPDVVVSGAGHMLPVTHAKIVNEFIRTSLSRC
jgi:pimeloyl-ACP methyl ester carboxylesterase